MAGHCWVEPLPGRATPLLYLMGDSDPLNPIDGGQVVTPRGAVETHPPARRSLERWIRAGGCAPDTTSHRDGPIEWIGATRCDLPMRLGIISGHGHVWPGGPRLLPQRLVGRDTAGVDATELIARFFEATRHDRGRTSA